MYKTSLLIDPLQHHRKNRYDSHKFNEFLKNISKNFKKWKRNLFNFFKIRVLENFPPEGQKKEVFFKHRQGVHKKRHRKREGKKWSWMVSLYRPWQDPTGQGHGEWNGNREKLYPSLSAMPRAHPSWPKMVKNIKISWNRHAVWSKWGVIPMI